jgi:rhodanese-related sulfurtransferase
MKIIKDILLIVLASAALALAYNYQQEEPLSLIYEDKKFDEIDDSILFGDENEIAGLKQKKLQMDNEPAQATDTSGTEAASIEEKTQPEENKTEEEKVIPVVSNKSQKPEKQQINIHESTVTYNQIKKIIGDDRFTLIDARSAEFYGKARIGDAINIFPYDSEDVVANKVLDLPYEKKYVVYCEGGACDASHKLADFMKALGFQNVFIYTGGWEEWSQKENIGA